ncbi:phage portal protein [Paenibacillus tengchongensis]|uniref:phage portal protein n=1 Tax=Paenibacillus tengchongensis TaxID=2608684 RepID=UPI00124E0D04|nr:phage portal protein [Paenibacillus tengchongensis]
MFEVGSQYPPKEHEDRIKRYRHNRDVVTTNAELIKRIKAMVESDGRNYIYANYADLVCKKAADLLFGESPIYGAGEEGSPEQTAVDRIVRDNGLNVTNYEMAYGNAYRGDSYYKIKWAQGYRGVLPETLDPYRVMIEAQNAAYVFPEELPGDRKRVIQYHIAVPVCVATGDVSKWELHVETHAPGSIITSKYEMAVSSSHNGEVTSWKITGVIDAPEEAEQTGVPIPLVVHVPNFALDDSWEGIDDITEHEAIFREINNRLTQIAAILDKHADPILTVPAGILEEGLDGNPQMRAAFAKVFEVVGKDEVTPAYVTWDGQLDAAFKELDTLIDTLLTIAEMPPVALGKENAGTSGATGLAVKYRMGPLLSKIARKRQYFDRALTDALFIAQLLEHAQSRDELDYSPTKPHIIFADGLPTDEREQAEIAQIRTGGKPTLAVSDAIKRLDGLTDAQTQQAIQRIEEDETRTLGTVDASIFNAEDAA